MDPIPRWLALATVLALVTVAGVGLAQNAEQSGTATTCADFNAAWPLTGITVARATGNVVEVERGTGFVVSSQEGPLGEQLPEAGELTPEGVSVDHEVLESDRPRVYVDFYDEEGDWVHQNAGHSTGRVPIDAAYGTICVGQVNSDWPDAPNPDAQWTYQDGF